MQCQKVLEKLGYSRKEARVYLMTLKLGEAHISIIADKLHMPRSTVQVIADRLRKDGLMSFYLMRRHKYWLAEDPTKILARLKEREQLVEDAIPKLLELKKRARKHNHNQRQLNDMLPLKEIADGIHLPVLIANIDSDIRYVNMPWQKLFGHNLDDVIGKPTRILKTDKTPVEEYTRLWRTLKGNGLFESSAIIDQKCDGSYFSLFTVIFSLQFENRKFYIQILEDRPGVAPEGEVMKDKFQSALPS